MTDRENIENARAAREARDAAVARQPSPSRDAADQALRRYLAAERYHRRREEEIARRSRTAPVDTGAEPDQA
jgi:hypothetical protein